MRNINISYYDAVLLVIPTILFAIPAGVSATGISKSTGLIAAGTLAVLVTIHALFINEI